MKKLLTLFITVSLLLGLASPCSIKAAEVDTEIIYLEDGDYIEIIVETAPQARVSGVKTATKTATCRNSSQEALWSVSVTGKFVYVKDTSCVCVEVSGKSECYNSVWKVSDVTTSKSGNTATAKATGTKYFLGIAMHSYELPVIIVCDTYGNIS